MTAGFFDPSNNEKSEFAIGEGRLGAFIQGQGAVFDVDHPVCRSDLIRMVEVAVETGMRFERDGNPDDPMDWMLLPRRLFDGLAAVDACLSQSGYGRALLVHGLGLDLDADACDVDGLFLHEVRAAGAADAPSNVIRLPRVNRRTRPRARTGRRLFTFQMVDELEGGIIQAFGAMMAWNGAEVRSRLRDRYGAALAEEADVMDGFDENSALVDALVSTTLAEMLGQIAADPTSMLADGLDLRIEQTFVG